MNTVCCPHMALAKNGQSFFTLVLHVSHWGNVLSAYNETPPLRGSPNKWRSQVTEASQTCHRPSSSALIYKHCLRGLSAIANPTGTTIWMAVESDLLKKKKNRKRQTALHNSKQKQMQRRSPVYNWFSRAASCCHSLSNEALTGALELVNHRASHGAAARHPAAPCWNTDITLWNFHVGQTFKTQHDFVLKGILSQRNIPNLQRKSRCPPQLPVQAGQQVSSDLYGRQYLCLRSRVPLWASEAKPLIGHGSSITESKPFHPKSHPNSLEEWDPWNGLDASQRPKSGFGRGAWFVRKPHLFQVDVKQCVRLSCVFPDTPRRLPLRVKRRK